MFVRTNLQNHIHQLTRQNWKFMETWMNEMISQNHWGMENL